MAICGRAAACFRSKGLQRIGMYICTYEHPELNALKIAFLLNIATRCVTSSHKVNVARFTPSHRHRRCRCCRRRHRALQPSSEDDEPPRGTSSRVVKKNTPKMGDWGSLPVEEDSQEVYLFAGVLSSPAPSLHDLEAGSGWVGRRVVGLTRFNLFFVAYFWFGGEGARLSVVAVFVWWWWWCCVGVGIVGVDVGVFRVDVGL